MKEVGWCSEKGKYPRREKKERRDKEEEEEEEEKQSHDVSGDTLVG